MNSIERAKKIRGVSLRSDWENAPRLERDKYLTIRGWQLRYDTIQRGFNYRGLKGLLRARKPIIKALRGLDKQLKRLAPYVNPQGELVEDPEGILRRITQFPAFVPVGIDKPTVKVKAEKGEIGSFTDPQYREMTMIELYTLHGTAWIADDLERAFRGRTPKDIIAGCAYDLARLFKRETGRPQWERVGRLVAENFPDAVVADDGGRDTRLWIYNLVKRYCARHHIPLPR